MPCPRPLPCSMSSSSTRTPTLWRRPPNWPLFLIDIVALTLSFIGSVQSKHCRCWYGFCYGFVWVLSVEWAVNPFMNSSHTHAPWDPETLWTLIILGPMCCHVHQPELLLYRRGEGAKQAKCSGHVVVMVLVVVVSITHFVGSVMGLDGH